MDDVCELVEVACGLVDMQEVADKLVLEVA